MKDYYQNKREKKIDLAKGFFMNLGIGVATFLLYWIFFVLGFSSSNTLKGIAVFVIIITLIIIEYRLINKFLKVKRYIAIGMIVAIVAPLLVVGACSPLFLSL